jgi:hypothetical protein
MKKTHYRCPRSIQTQKKSHAMVSLHVVWPDILEKSGPMLELIEVDGGMGT